MWCTITGHVGQPLPGVQCRLVDDSGHAIEAFDSPGELRVKGPNVFQRYLNRPDATKETFDPEGWFKTGDVAELSADGYYKILGRNSSDIIKVLYGVRSMSGNFLIGIIAYYTTT